MNTCNNQYTLNLSKNELGLSYTDLIERNKAAGISPSDTILWILCCANQRNVLIDASKDLRWAVIEQITGGDRFETICKDQQEAEEKAQYFWNHLTDTEKRRNTITVALTVIDDEGCCADWVRVTQEYDRKTLLRTKQEREYER